MYADKVMRIYLHNVFIFSRLQTECSHYRMIADEAYKQLVDLQGKNILTQSQNNRLSEWMELVDEVTNGYVNK